MPPPSLRLSYVEPRRHIRISTHVGPDLHNVRKACPHQVACEAQANVEIQGYVRQIVRFF